MLASVAASEARIANNLYQIELIRGNKGTVGVFSTFIDGLALELFIWNMNEKQKKNKLII